MTTTNAAVRNELARVREERGQVAEQPKLVTMLQNPKWEKAFVDASPQGAEATQVIRDVMTVVRKTPDLLACNAMSVIGAAMTCAQLGLRVNVLGHAWILPFKQTAQLVIGYQGYRELAFRSDLVESMIARPVHENDHFRVRYGTDDALEHEPPTERGADRGQITDYYAIVKYTRGGHAFWTMSKREVEQWRDKFAMQRDRQGNVKGPWKDHFDAMAAKTCFLQLAKWMPKSPDLATAIEADHKVRVDTTPDGIHTGYMPTPDGQLVDPDTQEPIPAEIVEER